MSRAGTESWCRIPPIQSNRRYSPYNPQVSEFARKLIAWQQRHGRHDLPWQGTRDAYRIWVSEIMLQQTQVNAVIPYYQRFVERFPDVGALAEAAEEAVLQLWSGLGYYARARNLHRAARALMQAAGGRIPDSTTALADLPGIGRSTAAAIAVFAFGARAAILDGNVKRVFARRFGIEGFPGERAVETRMWTLAEELLPASGFQAYTQGLMDLGATLCTRARPACERCPLARDCVALAGGRIAELPAPRPKKAYPTRSATWLVLMHREQVLLERRPPTGVWGGLWTFPELGATDLVRRCRDDYGCTLAGQRTLMPFAHSFTHFRLEIEPLLCQVKKRVPRAESAGRIWLGLQDAACAAVPVPVRKVLRSLCAAGPA